MPGSRHRSWPAVVTLCVMASGRAMSQEPPEPRTAQLAGRLMVLVSGQEVPPGQIKARTPQLTLGLELRKGEEVVGVPLDDDGHFSVAVSPGQWRIEYINVGEDEVEFFQPLLLTAEDGQRTCVGKLGLLLAKPEDLGRNVSSSLKVAGGACEEIQQECSARSPTTLPMVNLPAEKTVAEDHGWTRTPVEYLIGLRAGGGLGIGGDLFAQYVLTLSAPPGESGAFVYGFGDLTIQSAGGALGLGYSLAGLLEASAFGGYRAANPTAAGPFGGAWFRVGGYYGGLGLRGELGPGAGSLNFAGYLTLDIAPFYLLGRLL